MAIATRIYTLRRNGSVCCQGTYTTLCAPCRAEADRQAATQQHQQAPALFGDVLSMYNLNAAGNNGRPQHNAAGDNVAPPPPSQIDAVRAMRGLPPLTTPEPQMQTTGVPAPPSMVDVIRAQREAARPHQGERR